MDNLYLESYNKKDCNGCTLCAKVCPVSAIDMVEDKEGFVYPQINEEKCIHCNLCKKTCSNHYAGVDSNQAYMVINKEHDSLQRSTSGGFFYALAKYLIKEKQAEIFGVEYDENNVVIHNHYSSIEECKKFQGSKYVKSDLRNSFEEVERILKEGRNVLFTGTPCQCYALKLYLKNDYENLITCDIICHSNASPKVYRKFLDEIESKYKSKVVTYTDRPKKYGWRYKTSTIEFENGKVIDNKLYTESFLSALFSRPSCHDCKFCGLERNTDFTMGDLWGVENILPEYKSNNSGISLVLINTSKGEKTFNNMKGMVDFKEIDKSTAFSYNHNKPVAPHRNRELFFKNIDEISVIDNIIMCRNLNFASKIKNKIKKIVRL